jgi:predicted GTPase
VEADLRLEVDAPERITGRRVLIVEDGPTLTHGGMAFGAGTLAARRWGAAEVLDPRPHAVGTIAEAFRKHDHIGPVLPALGYSRDQRRELQETIVATGAEVIVDASPARLDQFIDAGNVPFVRVRYEFEQLSGRSLLAIVDEAIASSSLDALPTRDRSGADT